MHGLHQAVHQAAGFRHLDILERLFKFLRSNQTKFNQVLVNLQLVLKECNFQLFSAQIAPQCFEGGAGLSITLISAFRIAGGPFDLAHQKLRLVRKHRRFHLSHLIKRRLAVRPRRSGIVHA